MITKVCSKCGEEKDIEEFNRDSQTKTGYRSNCKSCQKESKKRWEIKNVDRIRDYSKTYYSEHKKECHEYYEKNKPRIAEKAKIYRKENAESRLEYNRVFLITHPGWMKEYKINYKLENGDRIKERDREYFKSPAGKIVASRGKHRRRALSKESPCTLTLQQWEKILESQNNRCAICGKRFCKSRPATKDHIIPLSKGGGLTFENVQALCRSCNASKNAALDHSKIITWSHYGNIT